MGSWKHKFVNLLVVYFTGFATAIYLLAPVPKEKEQGKVTQHNKKNFAHSTFKSDEFAQTFNVKMHKCLGFAKNIAGMAKKIMRQKLDERKAD